MLLQHGQPSGPTVCRCVLGALALGIVIGSAIPSTLAQEPQPTRLAQWRHRADEGDAAAMLHMGICYDTGTDVPQDFAAALSWYRRAAEAGSAIAAFNVAAMLDSGRGARMDRAEAVHWYRIAAKGGQGRAAYDLGVIYRDGDGVRTDRREAVRYFRLAAQAGIAAARASLAALGAPYAPSPPPAQESLTDLRTIALFEEYALTRAPGATARLLEGLAPRIATIQDAAGHGSYAAIYAVGYAYQLGIGVPADPVRAYANYARAAAAPFADIQAAAHQGMTELEARLSREQIEQARTVADAKRP